MQSHKCSSILVVDMFRHWNGCAIAIVRASAVSTIWIYMIHDAAWLLMNLHDTIDIYSMVTNDYYANLSMQWLVLIHAHPIILGPDALARCWWSRRRNGWQKRTEIRSQLRPDTACESAPARCGRTFAPGSTKSTKIGRSRRLSSWRRLNKDPEIGEDVLPIRLMRTRRSREPLPCPMARLVLYLAQRWSFRLILRWCVYLDFWVSYLCHSL